MGAATCRALAGAGFDVVLTYRNKGARADRVVAEVAALGGRAVALQSDITVASDRDAVALVLEQLGGGLDALVLNASGGLEKDLVRAPHRGHHHGAFVGAPQSPSWWADRWRRCSKPRTSPASLPR